MPKQHMMRPLAGLLLLVGLGVSASAETKVTQEVEVGVQSVNINNPEAKFEEYREVPNGVVLERYNVEGEGDTYDYELGLKKITQEDQSASFRFQKGALNVEALYDQTPHNWSNQTETLYRETSPGVFELPDGLQGTVQNASDWLSVMQSTFIGLAHTEKLGTRQDKTGVNLGYAFSNALSLNFAFSQEKKTGHKAQAAPMGFNYANEIAKSVDQMVYESMANLNYKVDKMALGLTYGLSLFQNDINTLIWDNTKRETDQYVNTTGYLAGDQSSRGRLATAPDNMAQVLGLTTVFDLPASNKLNADFSYTLMTQDDELLPSTINSAITSGSVNMSDPASLPSKTADATQTLVVQNYSINNDAIKNIALGIRVRSEQLGNSSKEIHFSSGYVRVDQALEPSVETARLAYKKLILGANADWSITPALTFGVDIAQETADRTHREYKETEEMTYTANVNYRPVMGLTVKGRYINADRKAKDFELEHFENENGALVELPGMRPFDLASRLRNAGDLSLITGAGPLTVSVNGGLAYDKFRSGDGDLTGGIGTNLNQQYGLLENRQARAGIDLTVDVSDMLGLFGFYQYEQIAGVQRSNQNNSTTVTQDAPYDWTSETSDRYDVIGVGADVGVSDKVSLQLGYDLSLSRGSINYKDLGSSLATKESLPDTHSSKQDYTLKGVMHATKDVTFTLGYLFERYDVTDYATNSVPLLSGTGAGQTNVYLGDSSSDYKAHVVSLMAKYKF